MTKSPESEEMIARIRRMYAVVDDLLLLRKYEAVDWILSEIEVAENDIEMLVAYLTITFSFRKELPSRRLFYKLVESKLVTELPERAHNILRGLE